MASNKNLPAGSMQFTKGRWFEYKRDIAALGAMIGQKSLGLTERID